MSNSPPAGTHPIHDALDAADDIDEAKSLLESEPEVEVDD